MAKGVHLVAVKVLDCGGSGSFAAVAAGVDWVTGNHTSGPAVANMSLGGSGSNTTLENAVRNSIADGVVYAIASGNSSSDACNFTPARVTEAITVNASTSGDAQASFSNYGSCTDIFAPGVDITSAWSSSDTATNTISGTSMATPHVTGGAALILGDNPSLTPAQVASTMFGNATPNKITGAGSGSPNRLLYVNTGGGTPGGPSVNNPGSQSTKKGVAVSLQMTASGGTTPYTWSATGLPAGLSINSSTGLISGTPNTVANYSVTVTATDAGSRTGSTAFSWTVTENLDGTWACSVPSGYTWDRVTNDLNVCNPSSFAYSYHLRAPTDNITVCSVPSGYTWDRVTNDLNVCNPSNFAYSYHLRVPVVGLWACSVPSGWSYSQTMNQLNVCNPSSFAYSYKLS